MNLEQIRDAVKSSFCENDGGTFSHVIPFKYTNFIDGMAWLSMLCCACYVSKDFDIYELCIKWLRTLHDVGDDARNFAPLQVKEEWRHSKDVPRFWYKEKPQAFAAPCAALWAIDNGAALYYPKDKDRTLIMAKLMCFIAPLFGILIKYIPYLRQHVNSVMMAHLLLGKRPPESMRFLAKNNMIYSYFYRIPCKTLYPDDEGIWPAKNYPGNNNKKSNIYSPICNLTGIYLQQLLDKGQFV